MDEEELRRVRIRELTRLRVSEYRRRQREHIFENHREIDILLEEMLTEK